MATAATLQSIAFIQVPPHGGTDPVLVNPAAIAQVTPWRPAGDSGPLGARIILLGDHSPRIDTDLTVAQVLALLTPQ